MKAKLRQVNGLTLVGKGDSNHWVALDTVEHLGGTDAGTKPMELILLGLGGCTAMDVLSILKKKRTPITGFEMEVDAEQAENFPKVFTKITVKYIFYGDKTRIKTTDIEHAMELSANVYCSVSAMLKATADIRYEYEIKEA
ncbi:MAG: OsmC family protein [Candidatus Zhuqueibacterota bacterium]